MIKFLSFLLVMALSLAGPFSSGYAQEFNRTQSAFIDNLITNPGAESGASNFVAYKDAAAALPVDGTGGSPTLVCTSKASPDITPLRQKRSFVITKSAANLQGEGCAIDIDIPSGYATQFLRTAFIKFTSANYADGDLRMYAYDVTGGGSPIELTTRDVAAGNSDYNGGYQVPSGSAKIRLIFHVATTSALAWDIYLDDIFSGKKSVSNGTVDIDLGALTPTLNSSGGGAITLNATGKLDPNLYCFRNGPNLDCTGSFRNGTGGAASGSAGAVHVTLPSGYVIDSAKIATTTAGEHQVGQGNCYGFSVAAERGPCTVHLVPSSTNSVRFIKVNEVLFNVSDFAAGVGATFNFSVPIVGWQTSTSKAEEGGARIIETKAQVTSDQTISISTPTLVSFDTVTGSVGFDTAAAFNVSTKRFVAPESGYYLVNARLLLGNYTSNEIFEGTVLKNGSITVAKFYGANSAASYTASMTGKVYLNKDDYLEVYADSIADTSYTIFSGVTSVFEVKKETSPKDPYGAGTVAAKYTSNSGQAITSSLAVMTFEDKDLDTHNGMSGTTYTLQEPGKYDISCSFLTASFTPSAANDVVQVQIFKNGSALRKAFQRTGSTIAGSYFSGVALAKSVSLSKGDTLDCRASSSVNTTMSVDSTYNEFALSRIGN